ncbi:MAG: 5-oxoprolinase subunit PxpB [Bacteroidota bacterium]
MEKTDYNLSFHKYSERSVLVEWPQEINNYILNDVLIFKNYLSKSNIESIIQVNHAYNSILIIYKFTIENINDTFLELKQLYCSRNVEKLETGNLWKIPVCYEDDFGWDLDEISRVKNLSKSEIIDFHLRPIYTVYFIGFLPGFMYLGGLDNHLHFPRKKNPRQRIEKGAVAIGGNQTGIYPHESPAGWNVIGNCPLELFQASKQSPCFAKAGDKIQFYEIDAIEHRKISAEVVKGTFVIENQNLND